MNRYASEHDQEATPPTFGVQMGTTPMVSVLDLAMTQLLDREATVD